MDFKEWFESQDDIGCLIGLEGYAAEQAWNARQAEIDALKAKIDELQARVDEALNFYNMAKSDVNIGMMQMAIYLKGDKDEL